MTRARPLGPAASASSGWTAADRCALVAQRTDAVSSRNATLACTASQCGPAILRGVNDAQQIVGGFPIALRDDVEAVAAVLPEPHHVLKGGSQPVLVDGETVELPVRVYNRAPPGDAIERLSDV